MGRAISAVDPADWTVYASYNHASKAVKMGSRVFVLANGNLFSFDEEDGSVETYTKADALSDVGIFDIRLCPKTHQLVIVYANANIDLLMAKDNVWNMPELKTKNLSDATINELIVKDGKAYISTGSGLSVLNLSIRTFENFYTFAGGVQNCCVQDGCIYVRTQGGILRGKIGDNLLDPTVWTPQEASDNIHFGISEEERKTSQELLEKAKPYTPNSPEENYAWHINIYNGRLLLSGGHFLYDDTPYRDICTMILEDGKWSTLDHTEAKASTHEGSYRMATDFIQDPADPEHHWIGTMMSGIYEFRNRKFVANYTLGNSNLETILPNSSHYYNYIRATALAYDATGNLWMCNNQVKDIFKIRKSDGKWLSIPTPEVNYYTTFDIIHFDPRGWVWANSRRTSSASADTHGVAPNAGVYIYDTNGTLENTKDDRHKLISSFYNQDGILYTPMELYALAEDLYGNIWIGCNLGLFVAENPENVFDKDYHLTQVKVNRNDDSGLADYLLSEVNITAIAIDGANRKWIGTESNGVYLVSADGQEMIHHFTSGNSPLLSNCIRDIKINGTTGEVYFATSTGLCSFMGDATDAEESLSKDNIKIFPNPVRPENRSLVHITGLAMSTDVKIADAAGHLVYQGTSNGGEMIWRCVTTDGKAVSPGIYYVLATDSDGKKGASAKIAVIR